jgi:hypothetical protein
MYVKKIIDNLNNARLPTSSAQVERMKKQARRKRQCAHALIRGQLQPPFPLPEFYFNNDPSAGSPTETLLRLLLPLNDQV